MKFSLFKGRLGQNRGRMLKKLSSLLPEKQLHIFFTEMSHIDDIFGFWQGRPWVDYAVMGSGDLSTSEM